MNLDDRVAGDQFPRFTEGTVDQNALRLQPIRARCGGREICDVGIASIR
jgi:hypothetical protein